LDLPPVEDFTAPEPQSEILVLPAKEDAAQEAAWIAEMTKIECRWLK
jgi:hypothetical protein